MGQVRERTSRVDPLMAGAVAAALVIGVTTLFVWRYRRR
jgi:heme/copper-type cytochrome/quinol oxidase subunit 2